MNATTGVAHSIRNAAGNMGSNMVASSNKAAIYKNSKEPLRKALMESAYKIRAGIRNALEQEAHISCKIITQTEHNQAEAFCEESFKEHCAEYTKMYDITMAAFLYEDSLKTFAKESEEYCQSHDVEEDTVEVLTNYKRILEHVDVEKRTVHGVEYESRELARQVRNDYNKFYQMLDDKDIFLPEITEKVEKIEYQTTEFETLLKTLLEEEKNLRTPEKIYENIYKIVSKNLSNEILQKLSIDIPNYMGDMQQKEELMRSITMMEKEELPLFFVDRSSKGKSGVVLTNKFLRIYTKGIFSNENRAIQIKQIKRINVT